MNSPLSLVWIYPYSPYANTLTEIKPGVWYGLSGQHFSRAEVSISDQNTCADKNTGVSKVVGQWRKVVGQWRKVAATIAENPGDNSAVVLDYILTEEQM